MMQQLAGKGTGLCHWRQLGVSLLAACSNGNSKRTSSCVKSKWESSILLTAAK
ncbi:MAG: hypothetical protein KDI38_16295 [Calditrichaeota bacterium]|nr:hypothetical protein [Calditrichota bacterium]MCB0305325.1 hypothetical protein [Calditrichota bacterium]